MLAEYHAFSLGKIMNKKIWLSSLIAVLVVLAVVTTIFYYLPQWQRAREGSTKTTQQAKNKSIEPAKQPETLSTVTADTNLDRYISELGFSGSVLVVKDNKVILRKGYGEANYEQKIPNSPNTLFPIGSTQKAMIATAILQLQEKKQLQVTDAIAKYFPDFPNGQNIRLFNLLNHTSGIFGRNQTNQAETSDELVNEIKANGTVGQPGRWHYLDANYIILTKLLEKITHTDYRTYLKQHIIAPSYMTGTGFMNDTTYQQSKQASVGYELEKGHMTPGALPNFSQLFGVGDMYMNPTDMYLFDRALFTHKLLKSDSLNAMLKPGSSSQYGMGFCNDPALIVNRGYLSGWSVSNGFSHGGRIYIVLFSNVRNHAISLSDMNSKIYTQLTN